MASIQERLNRLRGESSEASVYERLNHLRQIGQSQETESAAGGAGPAPAQRTVKSAPPAALPESKGKALTLPKAGERGFLAGGVSVEGSPFLYGSERAAAALLGAGEGVTDFIGSGFYKGVQGISSLGGLAPNPVSEWAGRNADAFLENSVTRDYEESIRERYRPSQGAENVTGIGQTIVQMLPGIGASKIVSAAGKGLNAAQAISRGENVGRALFGLQAAGNSASQAKAEGADTGQALAFGAASGALETAIEGIAGGIPGLGGGKVGQIAEAVKASPLVSRALDIAGEGGEEALSTVLTPYLQRAIYDPDAPNATPEEIAQSALMGAVAAGVLQGGLELPGTISDIYSTRRSIGSNAEITARAGERLSTPAYRDVADNPLATMLPTGEEALAGKRAYLPGSPVYQRSAVDNPSEAGYDGGNQTETGGVTYERGKETSASLEGVHGASLQAETPGSEETYRGRMGGVLEEGRRVQQPEAWAQGHIIRTPSAQAQNAASRAKQYSSDVFIVDDAALKARNPNAWAVTNGGKIYISDAVPAELADAVGYHESVHVLRQQDNEAYHGFLSDESRLLNRSSETAMDLLDLVVDARFAGKSIMDLTPEEAAIAYDELNALVWGYYKADPENARAQFSGAFQDYDAYIQELDTIMEGARQPVENQTGVGPAQAHGPESSVGAARKGFDPWSEFQGTKSEFFPEGANAARPVDVPTTDPQGRRIRKTASTAMGAKAIPDEVVGDIQNMVLRGELSYDRVSDKSSINRAIRTIKEKEFWGALEEFRNSVSKGVVSKDIATLGQQLLINAANAGDGKATAELLSLYAQMETTAGQAVQAASILRKLAPSDQLYAAKRVVSELEKTIQKNYKDLEITIDPSLIEEFNQQTDQAGRDAVLDKIYQNVADQVPAKWKDKWNAWRYMAMLFNPRTHIRNIVGNVGFQPLRWTKDRVAATIEAGVSKVSGGRLGRTKSFAANPALYKAAWADWSNVRDVLSGNKYDDIRTEINSRRRIFRTAPLEAGRKINSWALEAEDAIFKRITYADALAGYLQSNGVTAEQMRNNTVDTQLLSRARDYAGREALKATYQDRNKVSDKVVQIARALGPAGEAVLPFKRTPANILVRGMEYSPAGLAKTLTYDLIQVKRGKLTGAEAIDHIASGLTGSGLMALGAYLFAQGIVTSGGGDDEGQDTLNDLTGVQNYALNLPGGGNVTLDWLAPEALPFFMGVELMDSAGQGGSTAESISTALKSISDPMLELSMLQSLNDVIDSVSFSENKLGALVSSALVSYFTQPIPTFGGQIERSAEDVRMTTYTDKNLRLPTDIQYAIGRASARIPGWDYQQVPYIDAWGREEKSGTLPMRAMDNFLNPAYTSSMQVTDVDKEIQRLYNQTGDGGVVPDRPQKYITVDGERVDLTGEQYVEYATKRGQTQFKLLEELLDSSLYRSLGDEEKTQAVSSVYNYADMLGKAAVSDYQPEDWVAEAQNAKKEFGISTSEYLLLRGQYGGSLLSGKKVREAYQAGMPAQDYLHWAVQEKDTDGSGRTNQAETIAAIETSGLSQEEKDVLYAVEQVSDAGRRKWERARDWGLSVEDYQRYYAIYSGDGKKEEKLTALQRAGMTAAQANYFWSLMSKN